jgi:peptidoglycan-associated lipoprotein
VRDATEPSPPQPQESNVVIKTGFIVILAAILLTGCATGSNSSRSAGTGSSAERTQQSPAAARQAQLDQEQAELERIRNQRTREETAPQVRPLASGGIDGKPLGGTASGKQEGSDALTQQRTIFYDYDAYSVKPQYQPLLEAHAALLKSRPDLRLSVEGNCDERGSRAYNLALGQRRADAVKRALVLLGVIAVQISTVSFGAEKPKAAGHTEADLAQNRRSDLVYAASK